MSQLLQVPAREGLNALNGSSAPALFHAGLPYVDADTLAVDLAGAIVYHHQGLPFTAEGRLAATQDPPTDYGPGAAPLAAGRLCMLDAPVAEFIPGGVGVTAGGQVAASGVV